MNRLYSIEPYYSVTGTAADHHYLLRSARIGDFLIALTQELAF